MLHFFRKIRRELLTESKFFRYLKYGIGEIILVVIGILIALQIDNWNEERIKAENNRLLFQAVRDELVLNIEKIDRVINVHAGKDSLYFKVLHKKVNHEDYTKSTDLFSFPFWLEIVNAAEAEFNELLERKSSLTKRQDSMFSDLKDLYSIKKTDMDLKDKVIGDRFIDFRERMMEQPWWTEYWTKQKVTDEMILFCLNDPLYLNQLTEAQYLESGHLSSILEFRTKALHLYEKISEMLELEKDSSLVKNHKDFEHLIGEYQEGDNKLDIRGEEVLSMKFFVKDSLFNEFTIHPYSDSHILIYKQNPELTVLLTIEFGKNGEVLGLSQVGSIVPQEDGNRFLLKKIK